MEPERNLLILHTPRLQDISDWQAVKRRIGERAPDIAVRIADNTKHDDAAISWQLERPSLLFSVACPLAFKPGGGRVVTGRSMNKLDELEQMRRGFLPVPPTIVLQPNLWLPVADWGEYVIVKPSKGALGRGVRVVRTIDLARRWPELSDMGHDMLVQRFVEHVDEKGRPATHRVLVMFGQPLYAMKSRWGAPRKSLAALALSPAELVASNAPQDRHRELLDDPDMIALAGRAAEVFADLPVLAVDILRETGTGKLWIMEVNPSGGSWHLSSELAKKKYTAAFRRSLYRQFNALDRIADLLIEKTRSQAI